MESGGQLPLEARSIRSRSGRFSSALNPAGPHDLPDQRYAAAVSVSNGATQAADVVCVHHWLAQSAPSTVSAGHQTTNQSCSAASVSCASVAACVCSALVVGLGCIRAS